MRYFDGFSLVELMVVLAILAVLATVALPLAELDWKRQREDELRESLHEIRSALDAYKRAVDEGRVESPPGASGYPPNLEVLVDGVPNRRSVAGERIYFLRALPADPLAATGDGAQVGEVGGKTRRAALSWGLRSYASPPTDPAPGSDVFDVYSRSKGVGLNGRPYREW